MQERNMITNRFKDCFVVFDAKVQFIRFRKNKYSFFCEKKPPIQSSWGFEMYLFRNYYLTRTHVPLAIKISAFLNFIVSVLPVATS
jgi:hypothetical protein